MKTVLFINGCVREEFSRTLRIAHVYLNELKKKEDFKLIERNLVDNNLSYITNNSFHSETGEQIISDNHLAIEFAMADEIVLAAPFWEFMFPAVVSCYIEKISCVGITFKYGPTGSVGLCKASSFKYIYTAGDHLKPEDKISEIYLKKLIKLYGIPSFSSILSDGLDIQTNNAESLLADVCDKIKNGAL